MNKIELTYRRKQFIVRNILIGIPAALIADDLGFSRERVRQIFKNEIGENPKEYVNKLPFRENKRKRIKFQYKRYCALCGKRFLPHVDGAGTHYHSEECRIKAHVREYNPMMTSRCYICGGLFMPYRNSRREFPSVVRRGVKRHFCTWACTKKYLSYKQQVGNIKKALKKQRMVESK